MTRVPHTKLLEYQVPAVLDPHGSSQRTVGLEEVFPDAESEDVAEEASMLGLVDC